MLNINSIRILTSILVIVTAIFYTSNIQANPFTEGEGQSSNTQHPQIEGIDCFGYEHPGYKVMTRDECHALQERANNGERVAQEEFIIREYWNLLAPAYSMNIQHWDIFEDYQNIDICAAFMASMLSNGYLNEHFPNFFSDIQEKAQTENTLAKATLAIAYYNGINPENCQNIGQARRWFTLASEANHAVSQYYLGGMYSILNQMQDPEQAIKWLRKSAEQNHPGAQSSIGPILMNHEVPESKEEAIQWLEKSAAQRYAQAQYNLGIFCLNGQGAESYNFGIALLIQASQQGLSIATRELNIRSPTIIAGPGNIIYVS